MRPGGLGSIRRKEAAGLIDLAAQSFRRLPSGASAVFPQAIGDPSHIFAAKAQIDRRTPKALSMKSLK